MKTLIVLFFISLISFQTIAQENQDLQFYKNQLQKSKGMKTAGIIFTAIGGVFTIAGFYKMSDAYQIFTGEQDSDFKSGRTLTAVGILTLGGGTPLLVIGARNQKKYNRAVQRLSVGVNASAQSKGVTLTYKF